MDCQVECWFFIKLYIINCIAVVYNVKYIVDNFKRLAFNSFDFRQINCDFHIATNENTSTACVDNLRNLKHVLIILEAKTLGYVNC